MRTMGVEEELLLVDAETGEVRSSADSVLNSDTAERQSSELQQEQLETGTRPTDDLQDVYGDIVDLRRRAADAAYPIGAGSRRLEPHRCRRPRRYRGDGAKAQRATFARTNNLNAVVLEAVTDGSNEAGPPGTVLPTRSDHRR